ncbi:MAG: hypothetical protein J7M32_07430 [Deltaproteobacteria bacterium]|nr:hypothetical protein [Deltaproteobacteria bacterium]
MKQGVVKRKKQNVGLVGNIFDYRDDIGSGKRTIPVRFAQRPPVRLITLPIAVNVVRKSSLFEDTPDCATAMSNAIALTSPAGMLRWLDIRIFLQGPTIDFEPSLSGPFAPELCLTRRALYKILPPLYRAGFVPSMRHIPLNQIHRTWKALTGWAAPGRKMVRFIL